MCVKVVDGDKLEASGPVKFADIGDNEWFLFNGSLHCKTNEIADDYQSVFVDGFGISMPTASMAPETKRSLQSMSRSPTPARSEEE
jgi:hypothetical protein